MPKRKHICVSLFLALLLASGCANPNVNPPQAQPNTGYIDLYSPTDGELCWDVGESKGHDRHFRNVFSDVKPVERDLLRLAFSPGTHRFCVTFLNRVVSEPVVFSCDVRSGNITPVAISLTSVGQTTVISKQVTLGGTPMGQGGRRTKINSEETVRYNVSADVGPIFSYQPKTQIHYPNQPQ